jgi:hypothetical protein
MGVIGVWPGSDAERDALLLALSRHCTPLVGSSKGEVCWTRSSLEAACPVHSMLRDERVIQHLLFVRRKASMFVTREFSDGDEV